MAQRSKNIDKHLLFFYRLLYIAVYLGVVLYSFLPTKHSSSYISFGFSRFLAEQTKRFRIEEVAFQQLLSNSCDFYDDLVHALSGDVFYPALFFYVELPQYLCSRD